MQATRTALYLRISQDREGAGLGVERQREDCAKRAAREGWTIVATYEDNDVSASGKSRKRRPQFEQMIEAARRGEFDIILAYSNSRLTRRFMEYDQLIQLAEYDGISIRTVASGDDDLSTADGRMSARIKASVDMAESERIAERVSRKRLESAQAGKWQGGIRPFGFGPDGIAHNPAEADEIREATRKILRGASVRSIVQDWNTRGVKTSRDGTWTSKTFREMIQRPRNAGMVKYVPTERDRDGKVKPSRHTEAFGPGNWEAIVSEDERLAVVAILSDPKRRTSPGNQPRWLGSGIYICGICGSSDIVCGIPGGRRKDVKRPAQYRCRNRNTAVVKNHLGRNADKVDEIVTAAAVGWLTTLVGTYKLSDEQPAGVPGNDPEWSKLTAELLAIDVRRKDIQGDYADGVIDRAAFRAMSERLNARENEVREAMSTGPNTSAIPWADIERPADVRSVWEAQSLEQKRKFIRDVLVVTLVPSANRGPVFDPESVQIEYRADPRQVRPLAVR